MMFQYTIHNPTHLEKEEEKSETKSFEKWRQQ